MLSILLEDEAAKQAPVTDTGRIEHSQYPLEAVWGSIYIGSRIFCNHEASFQQIFQSFFVPGSRLDDRDCPVFWKEDLCRYKSSSFFASSIKFKQRMVLGVICQYLQNQIEVSSRQVASQTTTAASLFPKQIKPLQRPLPGKGHDGVGARQIDKKVSLTMIFASSTGIGNGFSRPVSGVLVHSSQGIKDSAFADVGISGEGDNQIVWFFFLN